MPLTVTPLTPTFGAEIAGLDLSGPLQAATFAEIRSAFDTYSVLVFHDQPLDDAQQIAFSERFGPLEHTGSINPGAGTPFARQSNIDIRTGAMIPPEDRRMFYQKANMLWHADSTFKAVPSLCSVLTAREVPAEGGTTEFASTRAAYGSLPEALRAKLEDLLVEHDFIYSRGLVGFEFSAEEKAKFPPVHHALVRTNSANGSRSVMIGAHAKAIVDWPEDESRALLDDLLARATEPKNCYHHDWRLGDVVVWDNQAVVHRATPYDNARYRRVMQRTTISSGMAAKPRASQRL